MVGVTELARKAQEPAPLDLATVAGPVYCLYLSKRADFDHEKDLIAAARIVLLQITSSSWWLTDEISF